MLIVIGKLLLKKKMNLITSYGACHIEQSPVISTGHPFIHTLIKKRIQKTQLHHLSWSDTHSKNK